MAVTIKGFASDWSVPPGARGKLDELYARKNGTVVNAKDYGALGDGAGDETAALQAAINAGATFGVPVFLPGGRYNITSTLNIPSGTTIRGAGTGVAVIDCTGMGATLSSSRTAMQSQGAISGTTIAVTADVTKGTKTATVTDASTHFAVGDRVLLSSDQNFHATAALKRGEIKRVEAVSATTVTFEDTTYDSYATGSGAKLQKVTPVQDITFEDFTLEGTDVDNMERGFYCYAGENITVRGCEFKHLDWNSLNFRHVVNFRVTDNTFRNVHWGSNTPNYYGLTVENATAHGVFSGNHGTKCRHLFTTGYTTTEPGVTRFIVVSNNVDTYSQSASFDTHDASEYITITGNTSSFSEANGINVEGRETIVSDNTVIGYTVAGIYVRGAAEKINVRGNRVSTTAVNSRAIYLRGTYQPDFRPNTIVVDGNILTDPTSTVRADYCDVVTITNNIGTVASGYALYFLECTRARILGNYVPGGTGMVYLNSVTNVMMSNNDAGANTYGIRMAGTCDKSLINGNDFSGVTTAIYNPLGTYKSVGNLGLADSAA